MMDEAQQILMNSLLNSGISLPTDVSSIKDLKEDSLVLICAQSLRLIDSSLLFSTSLPDSMAERFKICSEISTAVKNLGYRRDLSFHQPLATCMHNLQTAKMAIGLQISEPWLREYQVLPSRSHPFMQMSAFGGYILSGIKICNGEASTKSVPA